MKKIVRIFLVSAIIFMLSGVTCFAGNLGYAKYTNIVAYINHYPIKSYNYNGKTLIAAEELKYFGFDVEWNEYKRTLKISRNDKTKISDSVPAVFATDPGDVGKNELLITDTDVKVYIHDKQIESYGGLSGYTLINMEDLNRFSSVKVNWVPETKAVKAWVDGVEISKSMLRPVPSFFYYDSYGAPAYKYYWNWRFDKTVFLLTISAKTNYNGTYVWCNGTFTITDVINADGKSILNKTVSDSSGMSMWPYVYKWTDEPLSHAIILTSDDLKPKTASEEGGIIKFSYSNYGGYVSDSVRVDQLPYYK
ncbi:MAG: hypothetical protein IJF98_08360 [Firmicutes bacterium]|nr:hypothetical protein [Bacillota bacterium]